MAKESVLSIFILALLIFINCCNENNSENFENQILTEVNKLRIEGCLCGEDTMPPVQELQWDEALESAAERHVMDMTENLFFDHIGSDGSTPTERAYDAGFTGAYIGENIARGFVTVNDVMSRWKNSEFHCKTIMDYHYYFMGVAYEDYYWVQLFGSN